MQIIYNILDAEKYTADLDAVVFDMDDTLYSEKDYVKSGYKKIAEHFPQVPDMQERLWAVFLRGGKAVDEVFAECGLSEFSHEALEIYRNQTPEINLYDGVREMLGRIGAGKKTGIITDGRPEGQRAKIKALGLSADEIIITDELGGPEFRKPNELSFRLMQERLGVAFEKMAYVGDNIKKDFIAPEKLGIRCIYFENSDGLYYAGGKKDVS